MKRRECCILGRVLLALILTVLWIAPAAADEKTLLAAIDEQAGNCKVVSQKIFEYKELGQQEFKSSQLLMEELRKLGFKVTGDLKVPDDLIKGGVAKTAFRIHGIIKKGGEAVNVVPALAEAEFAARALDTATMEDAYKKMVNCAKAAEMATGATLEFKEPRASLKAPIAVPSLTELMLAKMKAQGLTEKDIKAKDDFGSSDLGNVAHAYPTFNLQFKIAPDGTAGHSDAMREAAGSEEGWKATVTAGKIVALAAYEMLKNPAKVKEIGEGDSGEL